MKPGEVPQAYRASVAAIIVNKNKEFFLVQQPGFKSDEWDFVKGGMIQGEDEEDTLKREVEEELGGDFKYKTLRESVWKIIYPWPLEHQLKKGFRGQARVSFWILYKEGDIKVEEKELTATKWFKSEDIERVLVESGAKAQEVKIFLEDWKMILQEFAKDFEN